MEGQLKEVVSFWHSCESTCELSCTSGGLCHADYLAESLWTVSVSNPQTLDASTVQEVPGKWPCLKARTLCLAPQK